LLTPLAIVEGRGHFVWCAIHDAEMEEMVDKALRSQQLAEKSGIDLEEAQRIFQAARGVAALRLVDGT